MGRGVSGHHNHIFSFLHTRVGVEKIFNIFTIWPYRSHPGAQRGHEFHEMLFDGIVDKCFTSQLKRKGLFVLL